MFELVYQIEGQGKIKEEHDTYEEVQASIELKKQELLDTPFTMVILGPDGELVQSMSAS